jgi:hypothetical protein
MAAGIRPTVAAPATTVRPTAAPATAIRQETVWLKGDLAAAAGKPAAPLGKPAAAVGKLTASLGELAAPLGELAASALRRDSAGRPSLRGLASGAATRASQGPPLACANQRWGDRSPSRSPPTGTPSARGILDDRRSPAEHSFSPLLPPLPLAAIKPLIALVDSEASAY